MSTLSEARLKCIDVQRKRSMTQRQRDSKYRQTREKKVKLSFKMKNIPECKAEPEKEYGTGIF